MNGMDGEQCSAFENCCLSCLDFSGQLAAPDPNYVSFSLGISLNVQHSEGLDYVVNNVNTEMARSCDALYVHYLDPNEYSCFF